MDDASRDAGVVDPSGEICSANSSSYYPTSSSRSEYITAKPIFEGYGESPCSDNRTLISWEWVSACGGGDACYRVEFV